MPKINSYTVIETREVEVVANSAMDAVHIAEAAFRYGQDANHKVIQKPTEIWGDTTTMVRIKEVNCKLEN